MRQKYVQYQRTFNMDKENRSSHTKKDQKGSKKATEASRFRQVDTYIMRIQTSR